jgi:hypothetical protein
MVRILTVRFRRDPSKDRAQGRVNYEGYEVLWPDGRPVTVGLDAFCQHGQRLLGLGRHLAGCREKLIELCIYPLGSREVDMTRLPGYRVRRFCLERQGTRGRVHFLDGTPTDAVFDLDHDEPRVLWWIGLPFVRNGGRQWFDLAARAAEGPSVRPPDEVRTESPWAGHLIS